MCRIIGDWDKPGGGAQLSPLFSALEDHELCQTFLEAGANIDVWETTEGTKHFLAEHIRKMREVIEEKFYKIASTRSSITNTALSPLHAASLFNEVKTVGVLLRHGADSNMYAGAFGTSLHLTTNQDIIDILVAEGGDIDARNGLGYTPLYNAISRRDEYVATALIHAGADVNLLYDDDMTVLDLAIQSTFSDIIPALTEANCNINGRPDGVPPLHLATANMKDEIIELLISGGADIAVRHEGRTVLHVTKCKWIASKLIAHGADINAKDTAGSTPLMLATENRDIPLMEVYLMAGADVSPSHLRENNILECVVQNGLYHILKLLITRCDLRQALDESSNLLHTAIFHNYEGIAFLLIEKFPHLVVEDGIDGCVSLEVAALHSSTSMLEKVIDLRPKVEADDCDYHATLVLLFNTDRVDNVKMLQKALIQPARLGQHVDLPLIVATAGRDKNLEKIEDALMMHNTNWMSDSELWVKPTYEHIETNYAMLQILIDNGADVSQAEWEGFGILHVAAWRNDERLMRMLLAAGANPLFKDIRGHTPAYWATQMSHYKMEKMLRLAEGEAMAKQQNEEGPK